MHTSSRAATLAALIGCSVLVFLASRACAQTPKADPPSNQGLPSDLLLVRGGRLNLGRSHQEILDLSADFAPNNPQRRIELVQQLLSAELGQGSQQVDDFFLSRFEVTNEQYLEFVKATGHRFPYHWWSRGKEKEYRETREKWVAMFPSEKQMAPIYYWAAMFKELPYEIPKGEEKFPVNHVDWRDAQRYSAWVGMRLPSEAEWTWASHGGKPQEYLLGPKWNSEWLAPLKLKKNTEISPKPVGSLGDFAKGPFGHEDLMGNVWEWMLDQGYNYVATSQSFDKEWQRLQKDKFGADVKKQPNWGGLSRVIKGGSYFSGTNPIEFRTGTRGKANADETVDGIGFRLAKSLAPGRDMASSLLNIDFDLAMFGGLRKPNIQEQQGIERYDLSGGLIRGYHTVSFVPANFIGDTKGLNLDKFEELTREKPVSVGALFVTEKMANPTLEPGSYAVFVRAAGLPKSALSALRAAAEEAKSKKKGIEEPAKDGKDKEAKQDKPELKTQDWRAVVKNFGITEEEAMAEGDSVKAFRPQPGSLVVPLGETVLLFKKNNGDFVGYRTLREGMRMKSSPTVSSVKLTDGKPEVTFRFGVPFDPKAKTQFLAFDMPLDFADASAATATWRVPEGNRPGTPATAQTQRPDAGADKRPVITK